MILRVFQPGPNRQIKLLRLLKSLLAIQLATRKGNKHPRLIPHRISSSRAQSRLHGFRRATSMIHGSTAKMMTVKSSILIGVHALQPALLGARRAARRAAVGAAVAVVRLAVLVAESPVRTVAGMNGLARPTLAEAWKKALLTGRLPRPTCYAVKAKVRPGARVMLFGATPPLTWTNLSQRRLPGLGVSAPPSLEPVLQGVSVLPRKSQWTKILSIARTALTRIAVARTATVPKSVLFRRLISRAVKMFQAKNLRTLTRNFSRTSRTLTRRSGP